jgi:hypothetical protein
MDSARIGRIDAAEIAYQEWFPLARIQNDALKWEIHRADSWELVATADSKAVAELVILAIEKFLISEIKGKQTDLLKD